ncbi:MAG TPA: hypothetical protein PK040_00415 [Anaerolineaceae bacterium]|nr:hypothetical protein [Anaerolineaceae bacterium]
MKPKYMYKAAGLWYQERDQEMIRRYKAGESLDAIAESFRLSSCTVQSIFKAYGVIGGAGWLRSA